MLTKRFFLAAPAVLSLLATVSPMMAAPGDDDPITFNMVVSAGAKTCLPNATATVRIEPAGLMQSLEVTVQGLPPNTDFNLFILQVPKAPFGISWYQGDIRTDKKGRGYARVVGIFSVETFSVAPGSAPAPVVFGGPFPDASLNPPFNPIQMYHLGIWFNTTAEAQAAGCPATVTPFSGEHTAGIQVLNTSNYPDDHGPLRNVP